MRLSHRPNLGVRTLERVVLALVIKRTLRCPDVLEDLQVFVGAPVTSIVT